MADEMRGADAPRPGGRRPSAARRTRARSKPSLCLASRRWTRNWPSASWIACQTRAGVAGMSMCVMPYSDSASTTAFITDVSEPAQPASPQPLTPSGLVLAGTGWLTTLEVGASCGARHGVVHERAGQQLAVVVVDARSISAWPMPCTTPPWSLALDHHRIDDGAEIVDRGIFHHLDDAGLRIDLDLGDVAAVGKADGAPSLTCLTSSDCGPSGGRLHAGADLRAPAP